MTRSIRVLIADDHPIVRKGIAALLELEDDIELVGEAKDGADAIAQAETLHPDVILMDLIMPGKDGIEATRRIHQVQPEVGILVLTSFATDDKIFPAIKAGARGYLLKDAGLTALVEAIRQIARGEASLEPSIARKILNEIAHDSINPPPSEPLSARELQVLRLVAQGKSNRDIAKKLVIAEMTVRSHVSNILAKLHLASRIQAALYALREGITSLEDAALDERK